MNYDIKQGINYWGPKLTSVSISSLTFTLISFSFFTTEVTLTTESVLLIVIFTSLATLIIDVVIRRKHLLKT
jgi:hypothetical protein